MAIYTVFGYCSCHACTGKWAKYHKTADGHTPRQGITCAAPKAFKFGARLNIEGIGERVVQDRMSVRYRLGHFLDIYFERHHDALLFGRQLLEVTVIG